jgi:hypothetical protein
MRANRLLHETWLDEFFALYYDRRPVDATFIGVRDSDHRLPDLSENGRGDALARMEDLLARVPDPLATGLSAIDAIDIRLARGALVIETAELDAKHFHVANPAFYTGEAVFGVMSLFLREDGPFGERVERATERLAGVPDLLRNCIDHVRGAPLEWTDRALQDCDGVLAFLRSGIDFLIADARAVASRGGASPAGFRRAAERAAAAFMSFAMHLDTTLRHRPVEAYAAGPELLSLYLREGHAVDTSAEEIRDRATTALTDAERTLDAGLAAAGLRDTAELSERLASLHPSANRFIGRFEEVWHAMRELAVDSELITWPDAPLRYVPQPQWARDAAPFLYFLPYRSPPAFGGGAEHESLVPPLELDWPMERQDAVLRATNDSVIKLNHVIHHGGIGHHVQNWHAFRCASRIGTIAAVDGASRIALFCGGTMAEGWACYATDVMAEAGALTPLERLAEARTRMRMCARAIVDVSLHHGDMTIEEAATFYERRAGMSLQAARAEAVKNSMFPGTALMYMIGRDAIHELRAAMAATPGCRFDLRRFHDTFLSWGSIPVSLIARAMHDAGDLVGGTPGCGPAVRSTVEPPHVQ